MRRPPSAPLLSALLALSLVGLPAAAADMEVKDPSGRRVLLKADGTWKYLDEKVPAKPNEVAQLQLLRQTEDPNGCTFHFEFENTLPYEVQSLVPYFTVQRANGVAYSSQGLGFGPVRPGDKVQRSLRFAGIACGDVAKVQVVGGDRCEMGELNKFNGAPGDCLARLRVRPSSVKTFEK